MVGLKAKGEEEHSRYRKGQTRAGIGEALGEAKSGPRASLVYGLC